MLNFSFLFQLLCLIGEAFDECSDEICGAVVNIRHKGDKLALWTHDATKNDATVKIG
jgi:translation initiation factor 4E